MTITTIMATTITITTKVITTTTTRIITRIFVVDHKTTVVAETLALGVTMVILAVIIEAMDVAFIEVAWITEVEVEAEIIGEMGAMKTWTNVDKIIVVVVLVLKGVVGVVVEKNVSVNQVLFKVHPSKFTFFRAFFQVCFWI